jgi:superfamily II DNA/RNA helicase
LGETIQKVYLLKEVFLEPDDSGEITEKTIDDKFNLFKHPIDQLNNFNQMHTINYVNECSPLRLVYQIIQFLGFIPHRYMIYHNDFYGKETVNAKQVGLTPQHKVLNMQKGRFGLLRVIFLKRLESSFYALKISIDNYRQTLIEFQKALAKGVILPISHLRDLIEMYGDDYSIEEVNDSDEIKNDFPITEFNYEQMQKDLVKEISLLDILDIQLQVLQNDNSKIKELAKLFTDIANTRNEFNSGKPKILVFSYFADTIKHLANDFKKYFTYNENECEFISAKNGKDIDNITKRFAPYGKTEGPLTNGEQEIRYLFATDVLSEGQNLQDCAILVNYDLHWNPVRMIQRNGRINRIGSKHKKVLIYNMHPNSQLEEYLKLVKRLEYKINLIRDIVGQDQRVLNANEKLNPIEFKDDIEIDKIQQLYSNNDNERNQIFKKLEEDEDYLTDDQFITDLRYFDAKYENNQKYKNQVYNIPKGKFGPLAGKDKQLLIFTQMNDIQGNKLYNKFFTIIKDKRLKDKRQGIDDLHALQLIQTDEINNKRQHSQLYKLYLQDFNKNITQEFIATLQTTKTGKRELDTGMKNLRMKFGNLLVQLNFEEKYRDIFDKAISYSNHSDLKQIERKIKKILKTPSTHEITELLEMCEELIINLDNNNLDKQPHACEGVLYYGS